MALTVVSPFCHAIQDLIDNKVIAPPIRPSIANNPLPNHNFGKGPRGHCLMTEKDNKEDTSDLIYDLPECFTMTREELMDRTFATVTGYDIWNEVPKQENNQTSINGERHFKPQENNQTPTNEEGGDTSNPKRTAKHPQTRGDISNPKKTTKHPKIGGDTSSPETLIPMIQPKLPTS